MNDNAKSLMLVVCCTLFTAAGQIFYKLSSYTYELNVFKLITNWQLLLGLLFYFIGGLLLVSALKLGDLSKIYPFISLTFIWVFILGIVIFKDTFSAVKVVGTLSIIAGVAFIGGR